MDNNKQKALDNALSQIERQFGKGSIMRLGDNRTMDIETISTGSLSLDIALGAGGLPMGRIVEIYGPESSGKTTLTLQVIAQAQRGGKTCAFVDAEHALDPVYAQKLGVDNQLVFAGKILPPWVNFEGKFHPATFRIPGIWFAKPLLC